MCLSCVPMHIGVDVNMHVWARPGWPGYMTDSWPEKVSQSGPGGRATILSSEGHWFDSPGLPVEVSVGKINLLLVCWSAPCKAATTFGKKHILNALKKAKS